MSAEACIKWEWATWPGDEAQRPQSRKERLACVWNVRMQWAEASKGVARARGRRERGEPHLRWFQRPLPPRLFWSKFQTWQNWYRNILNGRIAWYPLYPKDHASVYVNKKKGGWRWMGEGWVRVATGGFLGRNDVAWMRSMWWWWWEVLGFDVYLRVQLTGFAD